MAPVAVALIAGWIALNSAPALADQVRQSEWWLPKLHIATAQRISDGSGVTVAVLDTGVDAAAPDLAGSVLTGPDFSHSGRTAGGPFFGIHGTEIASLIAGHGHGPGNGDGIIGVAPAAKILSVRVTLDSGDPLLTDAGITAGLPTAIADGIRYAANNGASVIDLPIDPGAASATGAAGVPGLAVGSPAEQSAVAYARSKGVVLVAPAGDDGAGAGIVNYPAAYHGVISVGAFDQNVIKAPFSSRASYVTLTAAGAGVTAETPAGYTTMNSTTAASAVLAGIVAMIRSEFPALTPEQVTKSLISSTRFRRRDGRLIGSGYGTADAASALKAAAAMVEPRGQRAGAGAVARVAPMTPPAHATKPSLAQKLRRAGVISLAVLLVLLLPITVFALVRRYRTRAAGTTPANAGQPETQWLADARAGAAEQMEFLPSPSGGAGSPGLARAHAVLDGTGGPGRPASASATSGAAAFAGSAGLTGTRTFTGASAGGMAVPGTPPDDASTAAGGPPAGTPGRPAGAAGQGPGDRPGRAPVARAVNGRAKVSGSPPWAPAAKPDSELPWAAAPAPPTATPFGALPQRQAPAGGSLWDAAAGGDRAATPRPAPGPDADDIWAGSNAKDSEPAPASDQMYGWNPAETTETFPAIPADDER
jgi:hypothetical protein